KNEKPKGGFYTRPFLRITLCVRRHDRARTVGALAKRPKPQNSHSARSLRPRRMTGLEFSRISDHRK
ncbi:MAG: hypothetical protein LBG69_02745, partial [Zoogloeaceae bacterium]|nr:hypothetical protein [Zoogloeaceae bacterium]